MLAWELQIDDKEERYWKMTFEVMWVLGPHSCWQCYSHSVMLARELQAEDGEDEEEGYWKMMWFWLWSSYCLASYSPCNFLKVRWEGLGSGLMMNYPFHQ